MEQAKDIFIEVRSQVMRLSAWVNDQCEGYSAVQIILATAGLTVLLMIIYDWVYGDIKPFSKRMKNGFFRHVKALPIVRGIVKKEMTKTMDSIKEAFMKQNMGIPWVKRLPAKGLNKDEVMREVKNYKRMNTIRWSEGMVSGTVYSGEQDLTDLMTDVYRQYAWANPLHPDVFPDVRKMESEVVRMCCTMFKGDAETCGAVTCGGTESIMLACKAYRDLAYERGIRHPEMVIPSTGHAAFDKAGEFYRIKVKHAPIDGKTMKVDVRAMRKMIGRNTCMLVGSAPGFPHGILDPMKEIAELGLRYNVPVHMDSCLGGFLVPFMDKAGFPIPPCDFSLPGLTSISADTHKYGFAPKGSSVVLYRKKEYLQRQFFCNPDWSGGIYASPTTAGSRAGAISAACWATMLYVGEEGYVNSTRLIVQTQRYIQAGLRELDNIYVIGDPVVNVVAFGSLDFNIYRLNDNLHAKGWVLNSLQFPPCMHLCVTLPHTKPGVADRFISDMAEAVAEIMKSPDAKLGPQGAIYGMAASIPDRSVVSEVAFGFIHCCLDTEIGDEAVANGHAK